MKTLHQVTRKKENQQIFFFKTETIWFKKGKNKVTSDCSQNYLNCAGLLKVSN